MKTALTSLFGSVLFLAAACSANSTATSSSARSGGSSAGGNASSGGVNVNLGGANGNGSGTCSNGSDTKLTGKVYDPAGKTPIYNAVVFVPTGALPEIADGPTCEQCSGLTTRASAVALTDANGDFELTGVPPGTNVPLVVQVGKWRRQVAIPEVKACETTALTDKELTRLPRNQS